MRVALEADVAVVGSGEDLGVGIAVDALRLLDDPHERLLGESGPVELPQVALRQVLLQEDVGGDQDSADRLDGRGGEGDRRLRPVGRVKTQLLDDLRRVPVSRGREGAHLAAAVRVM